MIRLRHRRHLLRRSLPTPPAADAPAFSDLGVTFNDATRFLVGGLWQNVVEEGGQGNGSIVKYTDDLTTVQTGLTAEVNAGQFSGATLSHVQTILSDITTALVGGKRFREAVADRSAVSRRLKRRCITATSTSSMSSTTIPRSPGWRRRMARPDLRRCPPPFRTAPRRPTRPMPISRRSAPSSTTPRITYSEVSTPTTPARSPTMSTPSSPTCRR